MPATTKKYSRLVCVALAVMAASILSGCADDDAASREPLTLRPAPTEPGTPIGLDRARDSSGAVAFDRWPRACELLTDDEIKAVLPQTTKVERQSENAEVRIKVGVVASGRFASVREATAKDGKCSFTLDLPAAGLRLSDSNPPSFDVSINLAGTPAFVKQNFLYADKPVAAAGGRCFRADSASCVKGPVAFSIFGGFVHQEKDFADPDLEWRDRYRVNGEIVTISSPGGDSPAADEAFARDQQLTFDHLYLELAKIILRKI